MQMDELEAGNKLDALVAEEVMGWIRWKHADGEVRLHEARELRWLPRYGGKQTDEPYTVADTSLFCASTDIKAAFWVIEKLHDEGRFYFKLDSVIGGGWYVSIHDERLAFSQLPQPEISVYGCDDELPRAICMAALKAVRFAKRESASEPSETSGER